MIKKINAKWLKKAQTPLPFTPNTKPSYYLLAMFPYPSGSLHIGHLRVYTLADVITRYNQLCGKTVLNPIGWDAFGLPAENAAIERGIEPKEWTFNNIKSMKNQLLQMGVAFNWEREFSTNDPTYYKFTQHLFLLLYQHGMAYQNHALVNWDPIEKTVLANEQELLEGLDNLEWPEHVKTKQRNWIGKTVESNIELNPSVKYVLKDWLISRQRYWGTPIPIIHCPDCGPVPVPCGHVNASRESDTMDTFVDSSWYYLRFLDPKNKVKFLSKESSQSLPLDLYIGGIEHSIMHLLYARFIYKFLVKYEYITVSNGNEPFKKLLCQGMVLSKTFRCPDTLKIIQPKEMTPSSFDNNRFIVNETGKEAICKFEKMSKSKYNGVDPLDLVEQYGSDVTRLGVLYKSAPLDELMWDDSGFIGMNRWLSRCIDIIKTYSSIPDTSNNNHNKSIDSKRLQDLIYCHNRTLKTYNHVFQTTFHFNVAISNLIIFTHAIEPFKNTNCEIVNECINSLIKMIYPFAPCIAYEMVDIMNKNTHTFFETFPIEIDSFRSVEYSLIVDGQTKGTFNVPFNILECNDQIKSIAMNSESGKECLFNEKKYRVLIPKNKHIVVFISQK